MALSFATIATTLGPVIKPLIEKGAKMIAKWLFVKVKGRFTGEESEIERDLIRAIEEKNVEVFIKKYEQDLSVDIVQKIRALGNLNDLFDKVGRILQYKQYNEDSASVFMDLARALENVVTGVSFAEAGIQEIVVQDPETKERVSVTSEAYMVAILLRFAAAVWTQLAAKSTPSMKGWALEYDASMNIVVARPQILDEMQMEKKAEAAASRAMAPMPPPTPLMGAAASLDVLKFRSAYKNLMQLYRDSLPIRENYLKAASCLKTAQSKVMASKDRQRKTHKYMNLSHLEALVLGFRAEAQFWQFNMSENLPQLAETVSKFFEADPERTERYLLESMEVSKTGLNEFMDVLTLYENVGDGLAGALKLYRDALDKCVGGKDEKMIKRRIDETKKSASKNPSVLVADPKPIL
nr:hypothetical protein [Candidatus Njordarchaeum guaymaensis]